MPMLEGSLLVRGPGRVEVGEGYAEVLGARLGEGESLVVPAGRTVLVRVFGRVSARGSEVSQVGGETYESIDSIAGEAASRRAAVLVGPSDSGKSTLAAWTVNRSGGRLKLLSADIGQNEVYAPGFMALGTPRPPVVPGLDDSFSKVERCFVGSFQPRGSESRYVACASRLSRLAGEGVVVDTDGWVELWRGLESKAALAEAVGARLVVAVGLPSMHARVLERVWGFDVVSVPRLAEGSKSRDERSLHRERLIALRVAGGRERRVRAGEALVVGLPVFKGDPLPQEALYSLSRSIVYGESAEGRITVVARRRTAIPGAQVLAEGWERGLLAAVHSETGETGVGVVSRISYRDMSVYVLTRVDGPISMLEVGSARVNLDSLSGRAKW